MADFRNKPSQRRIAENLCRYYLNFNGDCSQALASLRQKVYPLYGCDQNVLPSPTTYSC